MSSETYKYKVAMSCSGCSGAVERVLKKLEDVESYNISLEEQSATVIVKDPAKLSYDDIFEKISKTGKATSKWEEQPTAPAA